MVSHGPVPSNRLGGSTVAHVTLLLMYNAGRVDEALVKVRLGKMEKCHPRTVSVVARNFGDPSWTGFLRLLDQ